MKDSGEFGDFEEVLKERDSLRESLLRLRADFENHKKRSVANYKNELDTELGKIAEAILPVLDACEAAINQGIEGAGMIQGSLYSSLNKNGLEVLDVIGKPFNPETSEAIEIKQDGGTELVVVQVLRTGYLWRGRVIRPAFVIVGG